MTQHSESWLQITSGSGPVECAWAVVRIAEILCAEAAAAHIEATVLELQPGPAEGTAQSALIRLTGPDLDAFLARWQGTVQWTARSPFRPAHKRKNWFVAVQPVAPTTESQFDPADVQWETMRASGAGGQHVNRTESAVRVTHRATGLQASASEERSQHRNRKLALARLAAKLQALNQQQSAQALRHRRQAHYSLERGNPVRIFHGDS